MANQLTVCRVTYCDEKPDELTKRYHSPIGPFVNLIGFWQDELQAGHKLDRHQVLNLFQLARYLPAIEEYARRSDKSGDLDAYMIIRQELPQIVSAAMHIAGLDPLQLLDSQGHVLLEPRVWLVFLSVSVIGAGATRKDVPEFDSQLLDVLGTERQKRQLERDKWIYDQKKLGRKNVDILMDLEKNHDEWDPLYNSQSLRSAIRRHAELKGLTLN